MSSFPTYPEDYRFPPKSRISLEIGVSGYLLSLIYIRGMSEREAAEHVATGMVEFIETWNIPPTIVLAVMAGFILWVLLGHWLAIGRMLA